jgi:DNA invertase Pin-like site-specific DNA recombinase
VNPDHLFLGTHRENMRDAARKGRNKGVPPPYRKLTEGAVRDIKRLCASGASRKALALRYRVTRDAVDDLMRGKTWAWVAV